MRFVRCPPYVYASAIALWSAVVVGCGPAGVRQERSIGWSIDGQGVGFQHNEEGIFVADKDGDRLVKVFQPGPEMLVASTPLWSPTDRRLIFTTACDPNRPAGARPPAPAESDPAGDRFRQRPVVYICWLREEPGEGRSPQPMPLFEAPCSHPGYAAANLAVRWHPRGDRVLYVKQTEANLHALFEYDLQAKTSRRLFPHTAEALAFDWSPDGRHLACVAAHSEMPAADDGIWIGMPDVSDDWWQVPDSAIPAGNAQAPLLERVMAARPVWTPKGDRFAFATFTPSPHYGEPGHAALRLATPAGRQVRRWAEGSEPFRDLHWSPDGSRMGLIRGGPAGSLHIGRPGEALSPPLKRRPVRSFAGWNATGDRLAYIVPDQVARPENLSWAFFLTPDPMPRDAVVVAAGTGDDPGREVFSGMRVTFPRWSPREDKLTVWFTFSPTHRHWFDRLAGGGLPPGDPAVVFEPATGRVTWLAVNAFEKAQVGHYHLLKHRYREAWEWYQKAEADRPPEHAGAAGRPWDNLINHRDFSFFQYYCLTKLGRPEEARAKLDEFRKVFRPPAQPAPGAAAGAAPADGFLNNLEPVEYLVLQDFYTAEAFLSLRAAEEAVDFFRRQLATAEDEKSRLSSALVLTQLLLLAKKHADYAALATNTLWPLLETARQAEAGRNSAWLQPNDLSHPTALAADLALLPLADPDFVATLAREQVQALVPRWEALGLRARDDPSRLTADLFLEAAYQKLGRENEGREAAARATDNPARAAYLPQGVAERVKEVRQMAAAMETLRELFAGR